MRHRQPSPSALGDVSERTPEANAWESFESTASFQAEQTEKSAMAVLNILSIIFTLTVPMIGLHCVFTGLSMWAALFNVPLWFVGAILCGYKRFWKKQMKSHPVTVASAVQCIGHAIVVAQMVFNPLSMPEGLVQHRVFLTGFVSIFVFSSAHLYIPMPLFLIIVCPLYILCWLAFHISVGFVNVPSIVWLLCLIASGIYVQNYQSCVFQREFHAKYALEKERHVLQASRKSFQGILSSIFDASCTCDWHGQLKEFSPQLQQLLGLPASAEGSGTQEYTVAPNLCSSAATDAERARLESFLAATRSCASDQASKIHCMFRRGGTLSEEVVDICMYAIVLQEHSHGQDAQDLLYVVLEATQTAQDYIPEEHTADPIEASCLSANVQGMCAQEQFLSSMEDIISLSGFDSNAPSASQDRHLNVTRRMWDECSLSFSVSAPSASAPSATQGMYLNSYDAETQTISISTADVGVQTAGSAARPPHPYRVADDPPRIKRFHNKQSRPRIFTRQRYIAVSSFSATPEEVIKGVLFMHVLPVINPVCSKGCCLQHTLLNFVQQAAKSFLRSEPCRNWDTSRLLQCSNCRCLQEKEEDEEQFICSFCDLEQDFNRNVLDGSSASGATSGYENETERA